MVHDDTLTIGLSTPVPLYRAEINGGPPQMVANEIHNDLYFSPDSQWVIFEQVHGFTSSLLRLRSDGQQPLNLTKDFAGRIKLNLDEQPYFAPTQISPDSQWVYFTGENESHRQQLFRVPMAGGAIEALTPPDDDYHLVFWSPDLTWPIVLHDRTLYWMRPDGGEFQRLLLLMDGPPADGEEQIVGWSPAEQLLTVRRDDHVYGLRVGEPQPIWRVDGAYNQMLMVGDWVLLVGGGIARMQHDGSHYLELVSQHETPRVTVTGLSLDATALVFFAERPSGVPNYAQEARLSDGQILIRPQAASADAFELFSALDWRSSLDTRAFDFYATTDVQPYRAPTDIWDSDIVAVGPPIDGKWSPPSLILMAGGLLLGSLVTLRRPR